MQLGVFYGSGAKFLDVSPLFLHPVQKTTTFLSDTIISPPLASHFNNFFGDPSPGKLKILHISVRISEFEKHYYISETNKKMHFIEPKKLPEIIFQLSFNIHIVYFAFFNPRKSQKEIDEIIFGQLKDLVETGLLLYPGFKKLSINITWENSGPAEQQGYSDRIHEVLGASVSEIVYYSKNLFEYPGIKKAWDISRENPSNKDIILYFHSKGMSYPTPGRAIPELQLFSTVINPWKRVFFIFEDSKINKIGFLGSNGGKQNSRVKNYMWFNFFWVRGSYLSGCEEPLITDDRFYYEEFLGYHPESKSSECFSLALNKADSNFSSYQAGILLDDVVIERDSAWL